MFASLTWTAKDLKRGRILFVNHTSNLGGPSRSLIYLLKYISGEHVPEVVAPGQGDLFHVLDQMGIRSHHAGSFGLTWRSIPFLCRLIVRGKFDLVYGNNFSSGTRNALIAAKLTKRPFVWHIREVLRNTGLKNALFLRFADDIIAVSQASARSVSSYVPRKKIHVLYNGIDLKDFNCKQGKEKEDDLSDLDLSEEDVIIVSMGHVWPNKGFHYIIPVACAISNENPNVRFLLLGRLDIDPGYVASLKREISKNGLQNHVKLLGFYHNVSRILNKASIFLHPSLKDANPRAVLEAMASGLPVVAFEVDGVREMVVDGETGYLVPVGDVQTLKRHIATLVSNSELRLKMGYLGRRRVRTLFTAKRTAHHIQQIIENVLGR